jgi:hypothetical protein
MAEIPAGNHLNGVTRGNRNVQRIRVSDGWLCIASDERVSQGLCIVIDAQHM